MPDNLQPASLKLFDHDNQVTHQELFGCMRTVKMHNLKFPTRAPCPPEPVHRRRSARSECALCCGRSGFRLRLFRSRQSPLM